MKNDEDVKFHLKATMDNAYYEGKEAGKLYAYSDLKGRLHGLLLAELRRVAILTESELTYWKGYQKGLMDLWEDINEGEKLLGKQAKKEGCKEGKKQC